MENVEFCTSVAFNGSHVAQSRHLLSFLCSLNSACLVAVLFQWTAGCAGLKWRWSTTRCGGLAGGCRPSTKFLHRVSVRAFDPLVYHCTPVMNGTSPTSGRCWSKDVVFQRARSPTCWPPSRAPGWALTVRITSLFVCRTAEYYF